MDWTILHTFEDADNVTTIGYNPIYNTYYTTTLPCNSLLPYTQYYFRQEHFHGHLEIYTWQGVCYLTLTDNKFRITISHWPIPSPDRTQIITETLSPKAYFQKLKENKCEDDYEDEYEDEYVNEYVNEYMDECEEKRLELLYEDVYRDEEFLQEENDVNITYVNEDVLKKVRGGGVKDASGKLAENKRYIFQTWTSAQVIKWPDNMFGGGKIFVKLQFETEYNTLLDILTGRISVEKHYIFLVDMDILQPVTYTSCLVYRGVYVDWLYDRINMNPEDVRWKIRFS